METRENLKVEINKKLRETNAKIEDLKNSSNQKENMKVKKDLLGILRHLESIQNNIILQYERLDDTKKEHDEFPELKKNIYGSFDSFEEAFSQAGSLVGPSKFRTRERSVDFRNPLRTK